VSEALQPLGPPPPSATPDAPDLLSLPLPPTSAPSLGEPPLSAPPPAAVPEPPVAPPPPPPAAPAPAAPPAAEETPLRLSEPGADDVEALRAKVAEQAHVIALAKTRVETLLEEKRDAYEREQALQQRILELESELAQTLGAAASTDVPTLAGLAARVAALEAAVTGR